MFYFKMHSAHFIYRYVVLENIQKTREENYYFFKKKKKSFYS